ncbi:hypothetical protein CSUI_001082 [Cystoisospora suis]|uniref:Uncharacterized protein n=1 Tax=Cystoisospora suis TaxID=483139 RepID=A0A2C6LE72_9APIC|nr:hypothetical protein CSUI_001082 [Cystoisospora suis]
MKKSSAFKTSPRLRGCDEGEPAQPEKSGERTSTGSPLPASSPDKASELSAQGVKQSASLINGAMVAHNFRQLTIM